MQASMIHFGVRDTTVLDFMILSFLAILMLTTPGDGILAGAVIMVTGTDIPLITLTGDTSIITLLTTDAT